MGPLLNTISLEVPGSLGEPVDGSALCLGMAGPPRGLGRQLSGLLSVRAWLLAPGVTREHFQPLLGPTSCLEEKTERPSQEVAFFLQSLFCGPWHVGRSLMAGHPPPHPSLWESTRGHGPLCYDSNPTSPESLGWVWQQGKCSLSIFIPPLGSWACLSSPLSPQGSWHPRGPSSVSGVL